MLKRIRQQWKTYMGGSRMAAAGCIVLAVWILLAVMVPLVSPWSYSAQDAQIRNQGVSLLHWFGTDRFGRDLFTRVWYGAGISLTVGIASALINGAIGVLYGAVSGFAGRRTDLILMRIADIISAIPSMLYVILLTLVMGAGIGSMILGLCVAGWIGMARIGNIKSMSDLQVGAKCLETGIWGCYQNVLINLGDIADEAFKTEVLAEAETIVSKSKEALEQVLEILKARKEEEASAKQA